MSTKAPVSKICFQFRLCGPGGPCANVAFWKTRPPQRSCQHAEMLCSWLFPWQRLQVPESPSLALTILTSRRPPAARPCGPPAAFCTSSAHLHVLALSQSVSVSELPALQNVTVRTLVPVQCHICLTPVGLMPRASVVGWGLLT